MAVQQEESTVNIEQIMDEIRADIKRRKLDGTLVPFRDVSQNNVIVNLDVDSDMYDEAKLDKNLDYINKDYMVILDRPFAQGSPKPVDFFKRAVRKVVRFYVNPVVRDQNSVNAATANALHQMKNCVEQQQEIIRELRKEVEELKRENDRK